MFWNSVSIVVKEVGVDLKTGKSNGVFGLFGNIRAVKLVGL